MVSLYVGDLHPDVTEAMLFDKFLTAGPLLSIRVCRDSATHRSLGYGYINFKRHADAQRALDTMQQLEIKGKPIRLSWSQSNPALRNSGVGNLFVKNIDKSIGSKVLHDKFSAFGNILSYKLATDDNGVSKGYGFVHFQTEKAANKAINEMNGLMLNGKNIYVGKFIPRKEREKELGEKTDNITNVYIKNFGDDLDDDKLYKMFEQFGKITSHRVMTNAEGKSKGFGFVSFSSPDEAARAVSTMNGHVVRTKPLYVAFAEKREVRKAHLASQHLQGQDAHAHHMPSQPLPESVNELQTAPIRDMPSCPAQLAQAIPGGHAPADLPSMQSQVRTNASHSTTAQADFIGIPISSDTIFGQQPVLGASMVAGGPMGSGPAAGFIATDQQHYMAGGRGNKLGGGAGVVVGGPPAGYNSTANRTKPPGGEVGTAQQKPGYGWRTI